MGAGDPSGQVMLRRAAGVVGRDGELAAADEFLEHSARRFAALLLEGETGIGKTAVWLEVIRRAQDRGFRVLSCRPAQIETKLSLSAIADLVEDAPPEILASLPQPQRRALEVALLRVDPGAARLEPREVSTAFRSLLHVLGDAGPLLVAVDDVQWLDAASARAVAFALRRLGGTRVGWLFTRRIAEPVALDVEGIIPHGAVRRVPVGPLSLAALHHLLADRLDRPLARPVLTRIHRVCGGNPFYALEIARGWCEQRPDGWAEGFPVPDDLRGLILQRVRGLSAATRDALLACAAASVPTTALAGERVLAPAEDSGLLAVDDAGHIAFCHPLYASVVYGSAPRARRREVHRRLAALVGDAEERARHLALAASAPDEEVALALERGAEMARRRGAWESAAELLEHAARLTPAGQPDEEHRRRIAAAEHHAHAGDRARARALVEAILAAGPPLRLRAKALQLLGELASNDDNFLESRRLLLEALDCTPDSGVAAACELDLAYVAFTQTKFAHCGVHARRALQHAQREGAASVIAESLAVRVIADFLGGQGVDWPAMRRALELEDQSRTVSLIMWPSMINVVLTAYLGRVAEARQSVSAIRARAGDRGDESDLAIALMWSSWLETRCGNLTTAAQLAEEGATLAALTGSPTNQAWLTAQQAYVSAHRGEIDHTRAACAEAAEAAQRHSNRLLAWWVAAALALLEISQSNPAAAWRACEPLVQPLDQYGIGEPVLAFFLPDALEALIALGDLDRAGALIDALERRGRELDRELALAAAARCRGMLLATRGDAEGALAALERALAEHKRMEMPFERARTLLAKGKVERRARQRAMAKASLGQSLDEFERLGARLFAERARNELARVGLHHASGVELTEGERRVAELAALGRTNKEIAAALFVSAKTVEANLARVYRKLGIASRAELGARMAGHQQI